MYTFPILLNTNNALGDNLYTYPILTHLLQQRKKIIIFTYIPFLYKKIPNTIVLNRKNFLIRNFVKYFLSFFLTEIKLRYSNNESILEGYFKRAKISLPKNNEYPTLPEFLYSDSKLKLPDNSIILNVYANNNIPHRQVYGIEWDKIVDFLEGLGFKCFEIGFKKNIQNCDLLKTEQLIDLFSAIKQSKYFIGLDSGPSHIAACLNIPSLIFMGPINPELRHLETFKGILLQNDCEHKNCFHEFNLSKGQKCKHLESSKTHMCCTFNTNDLILKLKELIK